MIDDLDKTIERMRGEIDDLQIKAAVKSQPWYRDTSTLVAALALVFSFGTTFVSYERTKSQDVEDKRHELRTVLQRLSALPREYVDASRIYFNDPSSKNTVGGFINQENALLSSHAADLIKALPEGAVSATEYQAVAMALQNAYSYPTAVTFLENAIKVTQDFNTEISAVRGLAYLRFIQGRPDDGRVAFQQAMNIFSKYPTFNPYTKASTNITTQVNWAYAEAEIGAFNLSNQHLESAEEIVAPLNRSPGVDGLRAQIAQARQQISTGNSSQAPSVGSQLGAMPPPPKLTTWK